MRENKDLLVVMNIFGQHLNEELQAQAYMTGLEGLYHQIDAAKEHSNGEYTFRVVVSACMVGDLCVEKIKEEYGDRIHIFRYPDRYTCQVASNKTILKAIEHFNEEYEGYLYFSSGIFFGDSLQRLMVHNFENYNQPDTPFSTNPLIIADVVKKLRTKKYGLIQLQVDDDHGYHFLGFGTTFWKTQVNLKYDYVIPLGNHANFHAGAIHRSLKDYYGKPISDVHGFCGMESTLSYCCAALKKQYLLLGNSAMMHAEKFDNDHSAPGRMVNTKDVPVIGANGTEPCRDLLWGRKRSDISSDKEAIEAGLGYYPGQEAGNALDWIGRHLVHDRTQYDNEFRSLNPKLKKVVKRLFFSNDDELNYDHIYCEIV